MITKEKKIPLKVVEHLISIVSNGDATIEMRLWAEKTLNELGITLKNICLLNYNISMN